MKEGGGCYSLPFLLRHYPVASILPQPPLGNPNAHRKERFPLNDPHGFLTTNGSNCIVTNLR